jgi:hypothetical protein
MSGCSIQKSCPQPFNEKRQCLEQWRADIIKSEIENGIFKI